MYEVIPVHALEQDLPRTLVENYVHWIHRGTMAIEFRPMESKVCELSSIIPPYPYFDGSEIYLDSLGTSEIFKTEVETRDSSI
jgi:hypothetical protein